MSVLKKLCIQPMFVIGLFIKLALIFYFASIPVATWYLPFMENSLSSLGALDPWGVWASTGGDLAAFPYGYVMWLFFLPILFIFKLANLSPAYGYDFTLLLADFGLLAILNLLIPGRQRLLLGAYWLSPVIIVASYILGLNDLIPALLLLVSIYFLRGKQLVLSAFFCSAAISAKFSMIVSLPFFCIYLYNNKALRQISLRFLAAFFVSTMIFGIPFLSSSAAVEMLLGNPEMAKIFSAFAGFGKWHINLFSAINLFNHDVCSMACATNEF